MKKAELKNQALNGESINDTVSDLMRAIAAPLGDVLSGKKPAAANDGEETEGFKEVPDAEAIEATDTVEGAPEENADDANDSDVYDTVD